MKLTVIVILIFLAVGAIFYIYFYQKPAEFTISPMKEGVGASASRQTKMKISSPVFENNELLKSFSGCFL